MTSWSPPGFDASAPECVSSSAGEGQADDVGRGGREAFHGAYLLAGHHHAIGCPHAAPVWGAVTGGTLYLYSERSTVKARNLATDPRVVVHLESGEDVLIMRGTAEDLGAPSSAPPVIAALAVKYTGPEDQQYLPSVDPDFDVLYAIRPRSAMTWRLDNYAPSLRRWSS